MTVLFEGWLEQLMTMQEPEVLPGSVGINLSGIVQILELLVFVNFQKMISISVLVLETDQLRDSQNLY